MNMYAAQRKWVAMVGQHDFRIDVWSYGRTRNCQCSVPQLVLSVSCPTDSLICFSGGGGAEPAAKSSPSCA